MKITYNHIIKFVLWTGLVVLTIWSNYCFKYLGAEEASGWYLVPMVIAAIIDIVILAGILFRIWDFIENWMNGNYDDILDKPVIKLPVKKPLIDILKQHLKEARRISDVEEISRLRNSIEIIEKYGK